MCRCRRLYNLRKQTKQNKIQSIEWQSIQPVNEQIFDELSHKQTANKQQICESTGELSDNISKYIYDCIWSIIFSLRGWPDF